MKLLDLPVEVLSEIISLCGPGPVTETCRTIGDVAISTRSLWTSVRLGPSQFVPEGREFLCIQLSRTGNSLLDVSIGPVNMVDHSPGGILEELCIILSRWNEQIAHLQISVEDVDGAGVILPIIFHDLTPSVVFYALRTLSVSAQSDEDLFEFPDLILSSILSGLYKNFPRLQFLSIPIFGNCLPPFFPNETFSHLRTLVLVGVRNDKDFLAICAVTELLSNTPQLETLWLKHEDAVEFDDLDPVPSWDMYKRERPLRVILPHLVRLAVSAIGTGTDLLHCLEAPSLADLHIDGSRQYPYSWDVFDGICIREAVRSLATRSLRLRRLAYTQIYLADGGLEWLLFGNDGRPPFPQLETLALHDCGETHGLDDDILLRFAQQPTIPLRRLVLLTWPCFFKVSSLVQVYQKLIADAPHEEYELELDQSSWLITDGTLEATGVKLTQHDDEQEEMDGWWTLGHRVDPSDSYAY